MTILTVHVDIVSYVHNIISGSVNQGVVVVYVRFLREVDEAPIVLPDCHAVRPITVHRHPYGGPAGELNPGRTREAGGVEVDTVSWTGKDPLVLNIDPPQCQ